MIPSEKPHQNLCENNLFLFKKRFEVIKNKFIQVKKLEIQVIVFIIMLTRSSERILNPMRYAGLIYTVVSHYIYSRYS